MSEKTHRQADSAHPLENIDPNQIKVTHENLDEALRVLRLVLDEEKEPTQ